MVFIKLKKIILKFVKNVKKIVQPVILKTTVLNVVINTKVHIKTL